MSAEYLLEGGMLAHGLRERADVMRAGAAAHAEIANPHVERLFAELRDLFNRIDRGPSATTMLWILISLFFCWLIFREFQGRWIARPGYDGPDPTPIYKPYLAILVALAVLFAWPPFHYWRIERLLSAKATELADSHHAEVHCNTVFDTFFDREYLAIGHANPKTGEIVLQYPWCARLVDYLDHPDTANSEETSSLNMFTHESMHARGEYNEAITDRVARQNALDYYQNIYMSKGKIGGIQAAYFSVECAPDKAMDKHLVDSTWGAP